MITLLNWGGGGGGGGAKESHARSVLLINFFIKSQSLYDFKTCSYIPYLNHSHVYWLVV